MRVSLAVLVLALAVGVPAAQEARPSFADWLSELKAEALARGIRQQVVDDALGSIEEPLPVVIERDRAQAEIVQPLERYIAQRLKPAVIQKGRDNLERNRALLESIRAQYGVAPAVILAIWGIESNFGGFSGVRPTVTALATLAWDRRRSALFRRELFDALEIVNRGDIELQNMRGSWAGAMGQPQFMPSSYLAFAEDFDGDGRRDIWASPADVFASIANYLKGHGWTEGGVWGREVAISPEVKKRIVSKLPRRDGTCQATRDMTTRQAMDEWRDLGVTSLNGKPLPAGNEQAALVSGSRRHFLVFSNYDSLLAYNCAHAYAVSVGLLADRIAAHTAKPAGKQPAAAKTTKRKPKRSTERLGANP